MMSSCKARIPHYSYSRLPWMKSCNVLPKLLLVSAHVRFFFLNLLNSPSFEHYYSDVETETSPLCAFFFRVRVVAQRLFC